MSDKRQQFKDNLVKRALAEKVGGDVPPDLSKEITDAQSEPPSLTKRDTHRGEGLRTAAVMGIGVLIAATVLLCAFINVSPKESSIASALRGKSTDEQLAILVSRFNDAVDNERYAEAITIANIARETAPDSAVTANMVEKAKFVERVWRASRESNESGVFYSMSSTDDSSQTFADDRAVDSRWESLSSSRSEAAGQDRELQRALQTRLAPAGSGEVDTRQYDEREPSEYITETHAYHDRRVAGREMPILDKIPYVSRLYRNQQLSANVFNDNNPTAIVGLDPNGQITPDLDIKFKQDEFGADIPSYGGFYLESSLSDFDTQFSQLSTDGTAELRGGINITYVDGLGIVMKGHKDDVARVQRIVDEIERQSKGTTIQLPEFDLDKLRAAGEEADESSAPSHDAIIDMVTKILEETPSQGKEAPRSQSSSFSSGGEFRIEPIIKELEEELVTLDATDSADEVRERKSAIRKQLATYREILENNERILARVRKALRPPKKTWRRAKATPNASRLVVGDKDELLSNGSQVHVTIDGFRARVLMDLFYYNDRDQQLEGQFKLRLPNDASLYYFAFGASSFEYKPDVDRLASRGFLSADLLRTVSYHPRDILKLREGSWDHVKEARIVPREKASFAYSQTVRRKVDPALVEWAGAGMFNAKVFPLMPHKLHRIVVGYDVNLQHDGDDLVYQLDLPEDRGETMIDLDIAALSGMSADVEPAVKPFTTAGRAYYRLSNPQGDAVKVRLRDEDSVGAVVLAGKDEKAGEFFATEVVVETNSPHPDSLPAGEGEKTSLLPPDPKVGKGEGARRADEGESIAESNASSSSHAVFMLDTSLSSQPDRFNIWIDLMKATLANNRDTIKQFNVLCFNIESHWWQPAYVANTDENAAKLAEFVNTLVLEGATDLEQAFAAVANPQLRVAGEMPRPDVFLLSDGAVTWGETHLHRIARTLTSGLPLPVGERAANEKSDDQRKALTPALSQKEREQSTGGASGTRRRINALFAYQTAIAGTDSRVLHHLARETGGAVFSVSSEEEINAASTAHRKRPWQLLNVAVAGGSDVMVAGRPKLVYPGQRLQIVGRGQPTAATKVTLTLRRGEMNSQIEVPITRVVESELTPRLYGQVAVGQLEDLANATEDVSVAYARHFRVTGQTCSLLMLESEADYRRFNIKPEDDAFVVKSTPAYDLIQRKIDELSDRIADPKQALLDWVSKLEGLQGVNVKLSAAFKLALERLPTGAFVVDVPRLECKIHDRATLPEAFLKLLAAAGPTQRSDYDAFTMESQRRRREFGAADALKALSSLIENNPGDVVLTQDIGISAIEFGLPGQAYPLLKRVAMARPYQPQVYTAIARCLVEVDRADMAILFYEVAMSGDWQQHPTFKQIASVEYIDLLRKIDAGEVECHAKDFAAARFDAMKETTPALGSDLVVVMSWNTDRTDVDLHVIDPLGEECNYQHRDTKVGGRITDDVTTGFGPEMFTLKRAPRGKYEFKVNYYGSDPNRTTTRTKVYVQVYQHFGTDRQSSTTHTVTLGQQKEMRVVGAVKLK